MNDLNEFFPKLPESFKVHCNCTKCDALHWINLTEVKFICKRCGCNDCYRRDSKDYELLSLEDAIKKNRKKLDESHYDILEKIVLEIIRETG